MRWSALLVLLVLLLLHGCTGSPAVDGGRAWQRVVRQVAFGPRVPGTAAHDAQRAWMDSLLNTLGARVEHQSFTDTSLGRPLALTNVIARYGAAGQPIVLCAHWDSRPFCDEDPDSAHRADPVPGANDGGSGVAVLLEVAEALHRHPPPRPVELVFFDGEDQGRASQGEEFCLGSRAYAAAAAARPPAERPVAGFLFDMVGDRDLDIHPEEQSAEHAANLVAMVGEGARATGARHFDDTPKYVLVDDHTRLMNAGIPCIDVVDFDYAAWHTHRDLPDQVSPQSLAEVAGVALWLVTRSELATAPQ